MLEVRTKTISLRQQASKGGAGLAIRSLAPCLNRQLLRFTKHPAISDHQQPKMRRGKVTFVILTQTNLHEVLDVNIPARCKSTIHIKNELEQMTGT
jgi:hypothetical protein